MAKMWAGRTDGVTEQIADDFNSSIHFDSRMYRQDIQSSMTHAAMLAKQGIISQSDAETLIDGLAGILADLDNGDLAIDMTCEDIHMFASIRPGAAMTRWPWTSGCICDLRSTRSARWSSL